MSEIQKVSVALTGEQVELLKAAVDSGEYATISEAVREAIREWQWKHELRKEELKSLRSAWSAGKESGTAGPVNLPETLQRARRELKRATERSA